MSEFASYFKARFEYLQKLIEDGEGWQIERASYDYLRDLYSEFYHDDNLDFDGLIERFQNQLQSASSCNQQMPSEPLDGRFIGDEKQRYDEAMESYLTQEAILSEAPKILSWLEANYA